MSSASGEANHAAGLGLTLNGWSKDTNNGNAIEEEQLDHGNATLIN